MSDLPTISPAERETLERALVDGIVVETSGSTARPKRVELSAGALRASVAATAGAIGTGNWVLALPLTYIAGIMVGVRAIIAGTTLVDLRSTTFDEEQFAEAVTELPVGTWFTSLVPTQLSRLVAAAKDSQIAAAALRTFDAILIGGQAIPRGLVEQATQLGARIIRTYGSAETAGGVVYDGLPIGDTQLRIATDGILEISTSSLADGYLGDEQRTRESFLHGWYRTTDLAHFDNGRLVIDGRADDIVITGGVKVSLTEIEAALERHGIHAVASWFPDDEWGQVPALVSTEAIDYDLARELIEKELGKAARPYRIITVDAIPTLISGKVDRVTVRSIVQSQLP